MKNIKIGLWLIVLGLLVSACSKDENYVEPVTDISTLLPTKEMRAVWISTVWGLDWPDGAYNRTRQKEKYIKYLDLFDSLNINTVFVQVRPTADAFYKSSLEPWSSVITGTAGKDPGYDVLEFMLNEAHARGIEFHAWMNPYRIATRESRDDEFKLAPSHIAKTYPELTSEYDKALYFNPALPEVREHILKVVEELISKYDVDGIHFDDYFYPEGEVVIDTAEYKKYGSAYKTVADFRRANVNMLVESVSNLLSTKKPEALFSISPAAKQETNYNNLFADVQLWCQNGWLDIVIPQLYSATSFKTLAHWWPQFSFKASVMIGYGIYQFSEDANDERFRMTEELIYQYQRSRLEPKMKGGVLFRAKSLVDNKLDIVSSLKTLYPQPSPIPFIGRKTLPDPSVPANVRVQGDLISWSGTDGLRNVVYRLGTSPSTSKVVAVTKGNSFKLPESGDYVVTAINADNNESKPSDIVRY